MKHELAGTGVVTIESIDVIKDLLKDHLTGEPHTLLECRCSSYHAYSALYPVIDLWQRVLQFDTAEAPADKLHKIEQMLAQYRLPLAETIFRCVVTADHGGLTDGALVEMLRERSGAVPVSATLLRRLRDSVRLYPIRRVDADLFGGRR